MSGDRSLAGPNKWEQTAPFRGEDEDVVGEGKQYFHLHKRSRDQRDSMMAGSHRPATSRSWSIMVCFCFAQVGWIFSRIWGIRAGGWL